MTPADQIRAASVEELTEQVAYEIGVAHFYRSGRAYLGADNAKACLAELARRLRALEAEHADKVWLTLIDHLIDTQVDRWHAAPTDLNLHTWLGLRWNEYGAWVEGKAAALLDERPGEKP